HARIHGIDPVTGRRYDALDPYLLLYVHATLIDSALLYEELTVGRLDDAGRQRFHEEQMLAAELVGIPKETIPTTVPALRGWLAGGRGGAELECRAGAARGAGLSVDRRAEGEWRPILPQVARLGCGPLPPVLREMYGVRWNTAKEAALRASFGAMRLGHALIP